MLTYIAIDVSSAAKLLLTLGICSCTGMQRLFSYDQELRSVDIHLTAKDKRKGKLLGGVVLTVSGAAALGVGATIDPHRNGPLQYLAVSFLLSFDCLITLQFVLLVLELWVRFRSLNANLLQELPAPVEILPAPVARSPPEPGRLRQLLGAYAALRRAAGFLQGHFGLPVAFSVAHSLCCSTASCYELLLVQMRSRWVSRLPLSPSPANSAMWLTYHWLKLTTMALSCAALKEEASATGDHLLKASVLYERRRHELEGFLRLATYGQPLSFSAAGFLNVDRRLLVSALAILVTYLVILGQFTPRQ
ncbi:uncharacterized protein LOC124775945 [Schistocerca piceifrons]|uniref:uncharacterized protein LOC124775945 n=1 Tax=Schistocerca piceifrons TaxID=274613 RepID=UPI001F5E55B7|nr:uncharacterized protein LOC124775945 [Schistocerca piceifrons]